MGKFRTHTCGELTQKEVGKQVRIAGWLSNARDHGGVMFLDIRDHYGITQVVVSKESLMSEANKIPKESTISVEGVVELRDEDKFNESLITGQIEISASKIDVLSKAKKNLPFEVVTSRDAREELRLKYRFLDLRNDELHKNVVLRSKIIQSIREKLLKENFLEMQTPILTSSSPEGARDFLVPSRLNPGKFYALPQAPQQFKQLLMVSGFDRYFQIAPCFRDEDARADRTPGEFYQLDMEMAFADQEDVLCVMEKLLKEIFIEFSNWEVSKVFERIPYRDSMLKYGTDKPDLRNPLIIKDVSDIFTDVEFNAFKGKVVRMITVKNVSDKPRSFFDGMVDFAVENGAPGLAWLKVVENGEFSGPIAKFIPEDKTKKIIEKDSMQAGDAVFFVAGKVKDVEKLSGIIRVELGKRLEILEKECYKFCWIVDYPMYEIDEETGKPAFSHNPFSMPQGGLDALMLKDPLDVLAHQYDVVCNGYELLSGAVRNHDPEIMLKAFDIAGYSEEVIETKFSALYNAFQYGAPPHAGAAPGLDRIIMLLAGENSIREIIAFPMNSKGQDLLMNAPCVASSKQLSDVYIKTVGKKSEN